MRPKNERIGRQRALALRRAAQAADSIVEMNLAACDSARIAMSGFLRHIVFIFSVFQLFLHKHILWVSTSRRSRLSATMPYDPGFCRFCGFGQERRENDNRKWTV